MKEVMTSFDIAAATHEINKSIEGSYLSKIYQIGTQTLLFRLRTQNTSKVQLLMEAGKRIHITSYVHETPKKPSAFCMSLRKYLDNGIIKVVKQHEFERIVIIEVATRQGDFQLVLELFGGGNTILVNPEGKILQAMTYKRMRDRNILRNEPFQHAPARGKNPQKIAVEDFLEIKSLGETEIVRALTKFFSISGTYAEEILLRAHINKDIKCATVTEDELKLIFIVIKQLISVTSSAKLEPAIIVDSENVWVDVTPVSLVMYAKLSQKKFECFNSALDEYYTKKGDVERGDEATKDFESELARQQRILQRQEKALEALKEPIIKNKTVGDLIYLHFGDLQSLFNKVIEQKISGKSWEQIIANLEAGKKVSNRPDIFFSSLEPKNQVLHVIVENKTFSLNLRQSIQVNADHYYMRSKKAEKKLKGAENQLQETLTKIEETKNQVIQKRENQQPLIKGRKKAWFEKFRWFYSSDGLLVIGGRDSTSNEVLIKKHVEPQDIIFHAEIVGAPFIVIKSKGKPVPKQTINEAAQLAASYSRAWKEMLTTLNVYWVTPEQVSKNPPSGQFLKKGSFMISGFKNFVRGVTLGIAIGINLNDKDIRVIGGPVKAISAQTDAFVEVIPGDQKSNQLAKDIRHRLSTKVSEDFKRGITAIPIQEFQGFIPLGRGKIK